MKIVMITSTPFPPEEGIGFHVYNLSKNLIKRGHQVSVVTRGGIKFERDHFEDINIIKAPFLPVYPFHVHIHGWFLKRLTRYMEENFDIIHFHNSLVPYINVNLPMITTMHASMLENVDAMELVDLKSFFSKILGKTFIYCITKKLMESSDKVFVISESLAEHIKKYYNFDIIYNGVNVDKIYPIEGKTDYMLYVGRLSYGKGIFDLLDAAKMLAKYTDIKLLIAGKGELEGKIQSKIKNESLNNVK